MWPAVVVDESCLGNLKGLTKNSEGKSVPVQFFGTHDFARYAVKKLEDNYFFLILHSFIILKQIILFNALC